MIGAFLSETLVDVISGARFHRVVANCGACHEVMGLVIPDALFQDKPMGIETPEAAVRARGWEIDDAGVRCPQHGAREA